MIVTLPDQKFSTRTRFGGCDVQGNDCATTLEHAIHGTDVHARPLLFDERRPGTHGRRDQVEPEDLPLRVGGRRPSHRPRPPRRGPIGPERRTPDGSLPEDKSLSVNAIPPNHFSYYEMLVRLVQGEAAAVLDVELMGLIAAIGIRQGGGVRAG